MTQSEFSTLLSVHQQWFPASCAASGMEMLLKWHRKIPNEWFEFQSEFQNQNIGWEKTEKLAQFGVRAADSRCDWSGFHAKFREQAACGRILLFSLPTTAFLCTVSGAWKGVGAYHVFLAAAVEGKELFVSKSFGRSECLYIGDLRKTYDLIQQIDSTYTIDVLSYDMH